ncbi:DUF2572 family protein [Haemophilus influenzae]|uniref:DUF2572 family protein n=1 Tax=Haemophilus influenzae R3021 TaxID=375432 RepID=A4N1N0_HAEIF|nr:DUF2572 family protein [Haemophilus influenzae]EDJ91738.1 hypothetical protein CGSHi22421_08283 [Haemophilus influenzae R3021]MCK8931562.1 DUF2572 family protein [Haemophilus influenzae]RFO68642.1 DUF2572 family protein [Haemophilus influenzae]RFO72834.1 DUF2572 family protein [Haemophilus influenzae]
MTTQKGIITLTILIFISGLLTAFLLLDDNHLSFFRAQQNQRKHYVERTLQLQKMTEEKKQTACIDLPLNNNERVKQISIALEGAADAIQYFLWCERMSLFKKSPKKGDNQGALKDFVTDEKLAYFRPHFSSPPRILNANKMPKLYWFSDSQTEVEINGTVSAVLIAEGDLKLTGKGRISGAVITSGNLTLDGVTLAYGKKTVVALVQQYSQWQLAEKSWSDFNVQDE